MIAYLLKFPIILCFSPSSTPSPPQVHFYFHVFSDMTIYIHNIGIYPLDIHIHVIFV